MTKNLSLASVLGLVVSVAILASIWVQSERDAQHPTGNAPGSLPDTPSDPWAYPVRLGDTREKVQGILGRPSGGSSEDVDWFPSSGLSVTFDDYDRAAEMHFMGNFFGEDDWILSTRVVVHGVRPDLTLPGLQRLLGEHVRTYPDWGTDEFMYYVWKKPPYVIEAKIWAKSSTMWGKTYAKDSMASVSFSKGI